MAKAKGRNMVVQLGSGGEQGAEAGAGRADRPTGLLEQTLVTPVPLQIAIEKLRGFVADHQATILEDRRQPGAPGNHRERPAAACAA